MRPVNRGEIPKKEDGTDKVYTSYSQVKDDLRDRLGSFCSYCEMNIQNQPDIEHVIPKSKNPALEKEWSNFLLACKSCNIIKDNNNDTRDGYVFPDTDNTSFLYEYSINGIKVKDTLDEDIKKLATATFDLVALNRKTDSSNRVDDRALARNNAWDKAQMALEDFLDGSNNPAMIRQTARSCNGFFSMWVQVFKDYPEVKKAILENVAGSDLSCYDSYINPLEQILRNN
ncbi:MAG: HNH endonuclease [Campylobacterota bacterium]|nr:HNH endonuclease [Campylobacterota bacterium]